MILLQDHRYISNNINYNTCNNCNNNDNNKNNNDNNNNNNDNDKKFLKSKNYQH